MVKWPVFTRFFDDEEGITLVEAIIVTPIVLLAITVMVELGVVMMKWNQSVKAVNLGARLASVSSPLVDRASYNAAMEAGWSDVIEGDPTPIDPAEISCSGLSGANACDSAAMNRLLTGGDGICGEGSVLVGMCDVAPWLRSDNVLVTYSRSGLGYVGRPAGAISTITVELQDVPLGFLILDDLLGTIFFGQLDLNDISLPRHRASATSEDLSSCRNTC